MSWKRPNILQRMEPLLEEHEINFNGYWIDVGTGSDAVFARLLENISPKTTVIQTDIKSIDSNGGLTFRADLRALPLRSNAIDGMVFAQVLHYIVSNNLGQVINHLANQITAGGYLVIIEYVRGKSYPWVPHHISEQKIQQVVNSVPTLYLKSIKYDDDRRRPKYSALLQKQVERS